MDQQLKQLRKLAVEVQDQRRINELTLKIIKEILSRQLAYVQMAPYGDDARLQQIERIKTHLMMCDLAIERSIKGGVANLVLEPDD